MTTEAGWLRYRIAHIRDKIYSLILWTSGCVMVQFSGSVRLRTVRIAFLVPPDDLNLVARVAQLSTCLWGGRYNPIIPFFEAGGERWTRPYLAQHGLDVTRGYVDFFEPDSLVEAVPGMAEKLGWHIAGPVSLGLPASFR